MSEGYILALDQGTTSSRAIIFDKEGAIISTAQKEFKQIYPQSGWVEHNGNTIWSSQSSVLTEALTEAGLVAGQIEAIGITNQRDTTLVWNKNTGKPVHNAIVWQDRRTSAYCDELKNKEGFVEKIRDKTGLIIDAYFSATKLKWILDNVDGARAEAEAGNLLFGTVDSWLVWNLTRGQVHVTDATNASRTMLYNIHEGKWDQEILEMFDIPKQMLPEVKSCSEVYGHTKMFADEVPIAGMAGDQQAALFGQRCIKSGMVKNTYGTGGFMVMNTGQKPIKSNNNLLTTIAWDIDGEVQYALEGSIFIAGAVVQWIRDELNIIETAPEVEKLAKSVEGNDGVYIVPAFAGLGAPHWNQHARGTIVGLTRGANAGHLARASLESIAYQTMDVIEAMQADSGIEIKELRVDGGAAANDLLIQFQSDILQVPTVRPKTLETTALGAAYLAGLAVGYWEDQDEINTQGRRDKEFSPKMSGENVQELRRGWDKALKTATYWSEQ